MIKCPLLHPAPGIILLCYAGVSRKRASERYPAVIQKFIHNTVVDTFFGLRGGGVVLPCEFASSLAEFVCLLVNLEHMLGIIV